MFRYTRFFITAAVAMVVAPPVLAQEITIGMSSEASSMDPHYHLLTPNEQLRKHIHESLTGFDLLRRVKPVLAESWKETEPGTWEFKLRKGVKFQDGSPFTAQDVIYSLCRIPKVVNSPGSYSIAMRKIVNATAKDPLTVVLKTDGVYPLLPNELSKIGIISATVNKGENVIFNHEGCAAPSWPATKDFNNGKLSIGTGPYKFSEFSPGSRIVLTRNDQYWGTKPQWSKITFRPLVAAGPRVAALLSGDVDLIEALSPQDAARLRSDPRFKLVSEKSARVIFLGANVSASNPAVAGPNPFKDVRVREAVSRAIDRSAITSKVLGGFGVPAGQLMYGSEDGIRLKDWYDVAKAKDLLTKAGYPNGFEVTLSGPNDSSLNDSQIVQAIAQMLSAVGIKAKVNLMTSSVFYSKKNEGSLGFYMGGWLAATGEMSYSLRSLVATKDKEKGYGNANPNKYSNPALDKLLDEALLTRDDMKRHDILQRASNLAMDDFAVIPLHYEVNLWAMKKNIDYKGRWDRETHVPEITLGK
ncbi:ABC transporter substrate-binding protein [Undibacterium sp. TS12]|uniref:ABC transporter substrate-binding protein n=1 Tax=Undibacterium sp. TS12 TaxID=2908202 RepID=UPI001F4CB241|nr:ABC transporter substrate-binding protein [Undibacterium sp. TS12]MCH8620524.1 ABC transporter substrate-binding protein [Undibacterium sp. TS12]